MWGGGPKCHVFLYTIDVRPLNFYKHGIVDLTNMQGSINCRCITDEVACI